jgi:Leucine-rich repeat (LRR) protein
VANNNITEITSDGPLTRLFSLDISNNRIKRLQLDIADTVDNAYILGNPGLRIKNPKWLFTTDYALIITDIYKLLLDEYLRARLYDLCELGQEYVDLERLGDDEYCKSLGLDLDST